MESNMPCVCEHSFAVHVVSFKSDLYWCDSCYMKPTHKFVIDNLAYLESLLDE